MPYIFRQGGPRVSDLSVETLDAIAASVERAPELGDEQLATIRAALAPAAQVAAA